MPCLACWNEPGATCRLVPAPWNEAWIWMSWNAAWITGTSHVHGKLERGLDRLCSTGTRANLCSAERDSGNETQTGTSWNEGWNEDRAWNEGPMGIQALFLDARLTPQAGRWLRTHTQTDGQTHAVTHAHTDGQTDRHTRLHTHRQTDTRGYGHTDRLPHAVVS